MQENAPPGAKRLFDLELSGWLFPLLLLALLAALRIAAPTVAEKPELSALDISLQFRERLGLASALDPTIRFVEMSAEDIARRQTAGGEYALVASVLRTLASLGVRVVAVDVIYAYGLKEEQALLAEAVEEIHAEGRTTVVLSASVETQADPPEFLWSLPDAGGRRFSQGVVNVVADKNWREYRFVHSFGGETVPSLALAALGARLPEPLAPRVVGDGRMEWKDIGRSGKAEMVSADDSRMFLNLQHSYYDDDHDNRAELRGRVWTIGQLETLAARSEGISPLHDTVVFFGYGAEEDGRPTAHGNQEPGMVLHATALNDLLHHSAIRPSSLWGDLVLYLVVALLAAGVFLWVKRKRWLIFAALFGILVLPLAGCLAVWHFHLLPAALNSAFLWGSAAVLEVGRRWVKEQRGRLQRDAMLGFYFSPAVLKQVTRNLEMIRPRGNDVAILLSDLRGFTTLCETQPVERVFELLNRLFSVETDAALREDGSLARFAGDQFLAYWGAPEPCSNAADRALRAALEIQRNLRVRREAPVDDLDSWLRIGIGLHCGRGLVGHVGSRSYRDYNIVGDSVNTTARIEGQTKNYAAPILASGEFVAALSASPATLCVDRVQVKGKALATDLHAVFEEVSEEVSGGCRDYEGAFGNYVGGEFGVAAEGFAALVDHPSETIATSARLLAQRCRDLAEDAPADWEGVFELTSK